MGPSDAAKNNSMLDCSSTDDDSFEFRILMAYAKRTLPTDKVPNIFLTAPKAGKGKPDKSSGEGSSVDAPHCVGSNRQTIVKIKQTDIIHHDGNKKSHIHKSKGKRKWKRFIPQCLRAEAANYEAASVGEQGKTEEDEMVLRSSYKSALPESICKLEPCGISESEPRANDVAEMLQEIMNSKVQMCTFRVLRSSSLEVDAGDDQKAIDQIVAFLTTKGDSIDEKIKKDPQLAKLFGERPSLSFFKKIMDCALQVALPIEMNSEAESETEINLKKFAFVVHATTRFAAVGNHPMARIMGFGTKYLQETFNTWVEEKGGWEKIIEEEHID
uniref:apoptosis facilitator Bcl-2-like protein 14 n=1 Tax=Pristiophorus japonicus TaxID=55135 RepID=UPI00398EA69C